MKPRGDLVGKQFGKLKVLEFSHSIKYKSGTHSLWKCQCDCGAVVTVRRNHLITGGIRGCGVCLHKKDKGIASFNRVYKHYLQGAVNRGLEFSLDKEYFRHITSEDCYYCGNHPSTVQKTERCNGEYIYNGIDRIDNSKGYTIDNCVPCCNQCNMAKRSYPVDKFKEWIVQVYNHIIIAGH
jgi:hypothetical protein